MCLVMPFVAARATSLGLQEGASQKPMTLNEALALVRAGDIVLLGEQHGTAEIAAQQVQVLQQLRAQGLKVSVGMEFFSWSDQGIVSDFHQGRLLEEDFLGKIGWGQGFPFSAYREQVLFPRIDEFVIALNAPRTLTGRIAKVGIAGLSASEAQMMPPNFQIGRASYFERFKEIMGGHVPAEALEKYFQAQSVWDDSMAWKANEFLNQHPDQVLVIIVGEFHVQYGGGLPDRLRARGQKQLHTFSFLNVNGWTEAEVTESTQVSPSYGPRSDYLWLSNF